VLLAQPCQKRAENCVRSVLAVCAQFDREEFATVRCDVRVPGQSCQNGGSTVEHGKIAKKFNAVTILAGGVGIAAVIAAASLAIVSRQATALPAYAQQTKLPCGSCHANPAGGGALKALGKKFQANGHKLK